MPELSKLVRNLEVQAARFQAWADAYPLGERSGGHCQLGQVMR